LFVDEINLFTLARERGWHWREILDLNATVEGMLKMLRRLIGEDVELSWQPGADLWPVLMDPSQVDQILANLCVNARDAIEEFGKIEIETSNTTLEDGAYKQTLGLPPGDYIRLTVADNGCGMDQETLSRLFEPFFTTKEIGQGTGLGLATVYGIVQQNHGAIDVFSEPGSGTTFRISLPRHLFADSSEPAPQDAGPKSSRQATILLVEDEPSMLRMVTRMLEQQGYRVLSSGSPTEALRLAEVNPGRIDLLMTDVIMPTMNGRELAARLAAHRPQVKPLFMSGYTADVIARQGFLEQGVQFLQKPFTLKELTGALRAALT
jgi:CheY-like chemotaxis protein